MKRRGFFSVIAALLAAFFSAVTYKADSHESQPLVLERSWHSLQEALEAQWKAIEVRWRGKQIELYSAANKTLFPVYGPAGGVAHSFVCYLKRGVGVKRYAVTLAVEIGPYDSDEVIRAVLQYSIRQVESFDPRTDQPYPSEYEDTYRQPRFADLDGGFMGLPQSMRRPHLYATCDARRFA